MNRRIYKFPFQLADGPTNLPRGAEIVMVGEQDGVPCMWALVDVNAPVESRHFAVRGTGHSIENGLRWVGSWQSPPYVWHLFEVVQLPDGVMTESELARAWSAGQ